MGNIRFTDCIAIRFDKIAFKYRFSPPESEKSQDLQYRAEMSGSPLGSCNRIQSRAHAVSGAGAKTRRGSIRDGTRVLLLHYTTQYNKGNACSIGHFHLERCAGDGALVGGFQH